MRHTIPYRVYLAFYAFAINPVCVHNKWMAQRQSLTSKHHPSTAPKKHRSLCCRKHCAACLVSCDAIDAMLYSQIKHYILLALFSIIRPLRPSHSHRAQTVKRPTAPNLLRFHSHHHSFSVSARSSLHPHTTTSTLTDTEPLTADARSNGAWTDRACLVFAMHATSQSPEDSSA